MVKHWLTKADRKRLRKMPKRQQQGILKLERMAIMEKKQHPQLNRTGALLIASQHMRKRKRR